MIENFHSKKSRGMKSELDGGQGISPLLEISLAGNIFFRSLTLSILVLTGADSVQNAISKFAVNVVTTSLKMPFVGSPSRVNS